VSIEWSKLSGREKVLFLLSIIVVGLGMLSIVFSMIGFGLNSLANGSVALGLAITLGGFSLFVILVNLINMRDIKEQLARIEKQTKSPD